jgi:hypothetical protein
VYTVEHCFICVNPQMLAHVTQNSAVSSPGVFPIFNDNSLQTFSSPCFIQVFSQMRKHFSLVEIQWLNSCLLRTSEKQGRGVRVSRAIGDFCPFYRVRTQNACRQFHRHLRCHEAYRHDLWCRHRFPARNEEWIRSHWKGVGRSGRVFRSEFIKHAK